MRVKPLDSPNWHIYISQIGKHTSVKATGVFGYSKIQQNRFLPMSGSREKLKKKKEKVG